MFRKLLTIVATLTIGAASLAEAGPIRQTKGQFEDKFRQLEEDWRSPNIYRTAGGEPGFAYWQQEADYDIKVALDEEKRRLTASETITYKNNSPDSLRFIWLQLDQNKFKRDSLAERSAAFGGGGQRGPGGSAGSGSEPAKISYGLLRREQFMDDVPLGYDITAVKGSAGDDLSYTIVGTLMRIDLPAPLRPRQSVTFSVDWAYNIAEEDAVSARSGFESFDDGNDIFLLAQWFPRLVVYS
ncbi:MAG: aminopeptidase, partial [Pseudomonadota bacterium]